MLVLVFCHATMVQLCHMPTSHAPCPPVLWTPQHLHSGCLLHKHSLGMDIPCPMGMLGMLATLAMLTLAMLTLAMLTLAMPTLAMLIQAMPSQAGTMLLLLLLRKNEHCCPDI